MALFRGPRGKHLVMLLEAITCYNSAMSPSKPSKILNVITNPYPGRDYEIRMECPEFTCLCPKTGQPDFAVVRIRYVPARLCVELKSLKLYLWGYRQEGVFHEAVTNQILDDLVRAVRPKRMEIEADFFVRGGIHTVVRTAYPFIEFDEQKRKS